MRQQFLLVVGLGLSLFLVACGDNGGGAADARPRPDARPPSDAPITADANVDAMPGTPDAEVDAMPTPDANPTTSLQIQAALDTPDGSGLNLPIEGATVTYLKPQVGSPTSDPAGFTVQADPTGPALFVAVDPASLTPTADVGDIVTFTITDLLTVASQHRATAITGFVQDGTGANVGALAQDISAATDVVTALDSYDSEIIDVTGTVASGFSGAGSGFTAADINTAGITGSADYELRVPIALATSQDIVNGCGFTLDNTPVHRFNARVQLTAFTTSDITLSGCPAPTVVGAIALSSASVRVTFDRNILASSVNVDGSQFTFDNGLTAIAATVSGRTVDVTTTAQAGGTTYTVTVANTVTDLQGTGLGTPNTATFTGFSTPAVVRINEVNTNITNGCDLIELRVISGGSMAGIRLHEANPSADLVTFPSFNVLTNSIIVVHLDSTDAVNCNPGGASMETTTILDQPAATFAGNYDTAFDWWVADTGLAATSNVLTLYDGGGGIMDAVFTVNDVANAAVAGATETQAAAVATATQWQMVGGGVPAGGFVDLDFSAHAALDTDATGTSATGDTIQRLDNTDDNDKNDWNTAVITSQVQTWGLINVGQTPL